MNVRSIQEARGPGMVASLTIHMNFAIFLCSDKTPAPSPPFCDSLHVLKDNFDTGRRTRDKSAITLHSLQPVNLGSSEWLKISRKRLMLIEVDSNIFCQFPFLLLFPVKERIEAVR
jgi:hypothetical protein